MTRRLSPDEARMCTLIGRAGGSWCPSDAAWAEPAVKAALKALVSKKRATEHPNDGAPPRFDLTAQGMVEVDNG